MIFIYLTDSLQGEYIYIYIYQNIELIKCDDWLFKSYLAIFQEDTTHPPYRRVSINYLAFPFISNTVKSSSSSSPWPSGSISTSPRVVITPYFLDLFRLRRNLKIIRIFFKRCISAFDCNQTDWFSFAEDRCSRTYKVKVIKTGARTSRF